MERVENFTTRVSSRLRKVRDELGLTIQHLADRPTATVLNKLSTGLGMRLSTLLGEPTYRSPRGKDHATIATRIRQKLWTCPAMGYRQRTLTPADTATALGESVLPNVAASLQLIHTELQPGACITFAPHPTAHQQQQLWVMVGSIDIRLGELGRRLVQGDCIAIALDRPCAVRNPGRYSARLLTATAPLGRSSKPQSARRPDRPS